MKTIPVNLVTSVTASNENANYPASNLLDDRPKKLWKGTTNSATLTITISGGISHGCGIINTNASIVSFSIADPNLVAWEAGVSWESGVAWAFLVTTITEILDIDGASGGACMAQWAETGMPVTFTAILTNNTTLENINAGVVAGGYLYSWNGPAYNFTEGEDDLSIEKEMSNGSDYVKDRDILRTFQMNAVITRADYKELKFDVSAVVKKNPAIWIVTNEDDADWLVYAKFSSKPKFTFFSLSHVRTTFGLKEVL